MKRLYTFPFSLLLLFSLFMSTACAQENPDLGKFRVAPYLQFGTQNSMVVMWETEEAATTTVEYGPTKVGDEKPNLSMKKVLKGTRTLHEVELTGLEVEKKYVWRVRSTTISGKEIVSEVYTFKTNVKDESAFAFALFGDSQSNPKVWGKIAQLGWENRPNFGILAGDLVDRGESIEDWLVEFFPPGNVFMSRFPMYTVIGNHENNHENYYNYMHNPEPEYYYTFKYGNAQFFMVDTNKDVSKGTEQYEWLEWELAKSTAMWKIVVHHHPPYSSEENDHGNSWISESTKGTHARALVPLYETYGVDFCLFGHTHLYERTWPIFQNAVNQKNGVVYINSGGAGGGLEDFDPARNWFTKKLNVTHHFCYFTVFEDKMSFQAIDEDGVLFDTFELIKSEEKKQVSIAPPPHFRSAKPLFTDEIEVNFDTALENMKVYYTTDGSEPTTSSNLFANTLKLDKTTTVKAIAVAPNGVKSRSVAYEYKKVKLQNATKNKGFKSGVAYKYYEGKWKYIPDFDKEKVKTTGSNPKFDIATIKEQDDYYGIVFETYVNAPEDGIYKFYLESDDGSRLFMGDEMIVDNDGSHSLTKKVGYAALKKGLHKIKILYFDDHGTEGLSVGWSGPSFDEKPISPFELFYKPN